MKDSAKLSVDNPQSRLLRKAAGVIMNGWATWFPPFSILFPDIFTALCCVYSFLYSRGTMLIMSHLVQNNYTYKGWNYLPVWWTTVLWID